MRQLAAILLALLAACATQPAAPGPTVPACGPLCAWPVPHPSPSCPPSPHL